MGIERKNGKTENRKAEKGTLRTSVKRMIQKRIQDGTYKPGDRIVETRLCKELAVSQAPVREAMLELALMGVLEERPYAGTYVREITQEEIIDIFNTRAFIEEYAARRACQHRSEEQLARMREILQKMETCTCMEEFTEVDNEFHECIVDAASSIALKRCWNSLQFKEWTYESVLVTKMTIPQLVEAHKKLYAYIRDRADHTAGAFMFLHIKGFSDEVVENIRTRRESSQES